MVAINEIIDLAKKGRKECLIFKVDFEKAHNSVSWNFFGLYDEEVWLWGEVEGVD